MPTAKSPKRIHDEFKIEDVGSSLLHELAKGLYQPETVLREYLQNAIDAHRLWELETGTQPEGPIQVEFRPCGISILDYGIGMEEDEVRNVKAVAVSPKQKFDADIGLTGHKGVGIWAGLSFFETLTLRTSRQGSNRGYQLEIHFKKILDSIDYKTDIGAALNPNYAIYEYTEEVDAHYTDVTLESPTQSPDWFLDRTQVEDAIRRICPCKINPNFVFQAEVEDWYRTNRFETFGVAVDGTPVYRDYSSAVEDFRTETFTVADEPVAECWYAVSKMKMLRPNPGQLVGFRIIQNGFVIGGTNPYSERTLSGFRELSVGSYPNWYVGEIHVISPDLRPNLARNDFEESSDLRRKLVQRVRKWYDQLAADCMVLGQKRNRMKAYSEFEKQVDQLRSDGAPLFPIDSADRDSLVDIRNELLRDEQKAAEDKRGKSAKSAAPIEGRRDKDVRNLRKSLLTKVGELLVESTVTSTSDSTARENAGIEQPKPLGAEFEDEDQPSEVESTSPSAHLAPTLPSTVTLGSHEPMWLDDEQDEVDISRKYVLTDVVLSLLEEILREEIPDSPQLQSDIVEKLQVRISLVVTNG